MIGCSTRSSHGGRANCWFVGLVCDASNGAGSIPVYHPIDTLDSLLLMGVGYTHDIYRMQGRDNQTQIS